MKHVVMCLGMLLIIGAEFGVYSQSSTPNYVKDEIMVDPDSAPSITISYSDGLGRDLQTSLFLEDNKVRVSGSVFDAVGRPSKTTVPFINTTADFTSTMDYIVDPIQAAQVDRCADPDNSTYPYSEIAYKPDPLNRLNSSGSPNLDDAYSLDGSNFKSWWYLGTVRPGTDLTNIDRWGFIYDNHLGKSQLDNYETNGLDPAPTYYLTISKGANDFSYNQEIKDVFGRTLSTCNTMRMRFEYAYDILGNLLKESPPDSDYGSSRIIDDEKASTYQYNTAGQLMTKQTPDAGLVEYKYNAAGQLLATQDAKQRLTATDCDYTVYLYDQLGRNYAIGINTSTKRFDADDFEDNTWTLATIAPRIHRIYDDPANLAVVLGATYTPEYFASNYCSIENTQGRLTAEIAYQENIRSASFWKKVAVDIYSYDEDGNVKAKLKRIPRMADFCMFTYSFDQQGNLIAYRYAKNDLGVDPTMDNMQYRLDRHGRLMTEKSTNSSNNTTPLVDNVYQDYGLLDKKIFGYSPDYSTFVDLIRYHYNLRNWPISIENNKFSETDICYDASSIDGTSLTQEQYNGNIAAIRYCYNVTGTNEYGINQYEYDIVNRLIIVTPDNTNYASSDVINYNNDGTIFTKHRLSSPYYISAYRYIPHSNKVHKIEGTRATLSNDNNFIYDPNGNMVLDYSKKMYIEYDWRNLPVTFTFYNSIPITILQAADETARAALWHNLKQNIEATATPVSQVKMAYDASGNRVMKKEYKLYEN
jgi:YD repeat-containing protein